MLSVKALELKENLSSKRKSDCSDKYNLSPPSKLPRIETEEDQTKLENDFNSYQYWKDPLPDISSELNNITSYMVVEENGGTQTNSPHLQLQPAVGWRSS